MDSKLPSFLPLLFFVAHFHPSLSASGKTNANPGNAEAGPTDLARECIRERYPLTNPFYDFEDVIDYDEELNLASMVEAY